MIHAQTDTMHDVMWNITSLSSNTEGDRPNTIRTATLTYSQNKSQLLSFHLGSQPAPTIGQLQNARRELASGQRCKANLRIRSGGRRIKGRLAR